MKSQCSRARGELLGAAKHADAPHPSQYTQRQSAEKIEHARKKRGVTSHTLTPRGKGNQKEQTLKAPYTGRIVTETPHAVENELPAHAFAT